MEIWISRITLWQVCVVNLGEKFSPGPQLEPEPPALRTNTLTNWATQTIHLAKLEFFSY